MNTERDAIVERVDNALTLLAEHVDSVHIFVTYHAEDGETSAAYESGRGNFYARQGQVDEWLRFQHEYQRHEARKRATEDAE